MSLEKEKKKNYFREIKSIKTIKSIVAQLFFSFLNNNKKYITIKFDKKNISKLIYLNIFNLVLSKKREKKEKKATTPFLKED